MVNRIKQLEEEISKELEEEISKDEPQRSEEEIVESAKISKVQAQNHDLSALLEELDAEEKSLLREKTDLVIVEEQLTQKIKAEIEARKQKIDELKGEIPDLRQRCETLATVLGIQVQK